jgi:excisionase family DNA binding protein
MAQHTAADDDPILTTSAVARLLGVAVSTAQLWIESGRLDAWKTPGGHRRVRLSTVTRLLQQGAAADARSQPARAVDDPEFLPLAAPAYPVPGNEAARLAALQATRLVDTPAEAVFDRLTWLATQVTDCPIAVLSLLTARRQWFKSRAGAAIEFTESPREFAFCSHAILQEQAFMVEDARRDPRFANNPFVTGKPHLRFYAAFPIHDADGYRVGALCVADTVQRRLADKAIRALRELAAIASDEIKRRR